jgi:hypothetical protein
MVCVGGFGVMHAGRCRDRVGDGGRDCLGMCSIRDEMLVRRAADGALHAKSREALLMRRRVTLSETDRIRAPVADERARAKIAHISAQRHVNVSG